MKIGFDIGGVLSKYPEILLEMIKSLSCSNQIYIITDQHPKDEVLVCLKQNGFGFIPEENVYCAEYEKYGNMAKAVLIKELGIQVFVDDFDGYLQWDSKFGPQPLLLKVQPDGFKPYWSDVWKCEGGDFGRRSFSF